MNNIKQKIKALKFARKQIASGGREYICFALEDYLENNCDSFDAVEQLKAYISRSLGNGETSCASLERWLTHNGYIKATYIAWEGQGAKKLRQTRLNWIDWMIACYEEDMLK